MSLHNGEEKSSSVPKYVTLFAGVSLLSENVHYYLSYGV